MLSVVGFLGRGLFLKLLAGLAIAAAVGAVLLGVRNAGRNAERVEGMRRQLDNARTRIDVENDVGRSGDDAVRKRLLDRWTRD